MVPKIMLLMYLATSCYPMVLYIDKHEATRQLIFAAIEITYGSTNLDCLLSFLSNIPQSCLVYA